MDRIERDTHGIFDLLVIQHERQEHIVTPGTISQVCRTWKDIAYHTPMLWDTVFVDMKPSTRNTIQDDIVKVSEASIKLKQWLDRAGRYPLTVKIEGAELVQKQLLEYSNQWKCIDIYCLGNHPELHLELERIMKQPPALLESFICRPSSHCSVFGQMTDIGQHPLFSIEATPNLTQITKSRRFPLSISMSHIELCRWDGIADLNIINNLKQMESVRDCYMYNPWPFHRLRSPSPPLIRLSFLENLTIHSLRAHAHDYILPSLELPMLRNFTFPTILNKAESVLPIA
ncbi:hypothetical protein BDQ17DRAFT_414730 [Cyathus striatus]|nr:hypothetical protein BDQ17DRAFT_414730 [Cyathus striatus]